jgi:adenylylsulfate kinase-like enzyme
MLNVKKLTSHSHFIFVKETEQKIDQMTQNNSNSWNSNFATRGTIWLTGLPAAGKTTLANILHQKLKQLGKFEYKVLLKNNSIT